ncbi:MAG: signal peptidase I [Planctomycetota bacterium]|nr:signal peptidase I [Planctomycetota bacterium]
MAALIYAVFAVLMLLANPALLYLAARIVRVSGITWWRAYGTMLLLYVLGAVTILAGELASRAPLGVAIGIGLAGLVFAILLVRERLRTSFWRAAGCYLLLAAAAVGVALGVRAGVVEAVYVPTGSMSPAILPGDRILIDKITLRFRPPRRGEVVVFRGPAATMGLDESTAQRYFRDTDVAIKRVAAVEGDRVDMKDGGVYVNDLRLADSLRGFYRTQYARFTPAYPLVVPPGKIFLLGDDPQKSLDGRMWGLTDVQSVIGLAGVVYASREVQETDSRPLGPLSTSPGRLRWGRVGTVVH